MFTVYFDQGQGSHRYIKYDVKNDVTVISFVCYFPEICFTFYLRSTLNVFTHWISTLERGKQVKMTVI